MLILDHKDVEAVLDMPGCIESLEKAYRQMDFQGAVNRPRSHTFIKTEGRDTFYLLKSIEGGISELGVAALRVNSERWRLVKDPRPKIKKLPTTEDGHFTEFILLFSTANGELLAVLPDGHIQRSRVAATSALAAKYMARREGRQMALYGAGWQAEAHAAAFKAIFPIEKIKVYSPTAEHRKAFARRISGSLDLDIEAVETPFEAMEGADFVVCASNSEQPVFMPDWLQKGQFISTVKSREVSQEILDRCDLVVLHNKIPVMDFVGGGELPREMISTSSDLKVQDLPQLSNVVSGKLSGRTNPDEITLFIQGDEGGEGLGIQFAATGKWVCEEALKRGLGRKVPADWSLDFEEHP